MQKEISDPRSSKHDTSVVVVGHKPFVVPDDPIYTGMQVGAGNDIPNLIRDNTGKNISEKNATYCELTAQYWLWKNSTANIKGLVHYRRILGSQRSKAIPFESMDHRRSKAVKGEEINQLLQQYDVILAKAHNYVTETALQHYERSHVSGEGFNIIREYLQENYPEYVHSFEDSLNSKESHLFNIMIAKSDVFDAYSMWLFEVLGEVERKLDISHYSPVEMRVFGYLPELLLDTWINANEERKKMGEDR